MRGKYVIAGIGHTAIRAAAGPRHRLDERRGLPQRARRCGHREVRGRCAVRQGADLALFLDVRADARRGDAPAAEGRRRVGSGRRHQHQHDLVRLHGDRRRPVRDRDRRASRTTRRPARARPTRRHGATMRAYGWFCDRGRLRHDDAAAHGANTAPSRSSSARSRSRCAITAPTIRTRRCACRSRSTNTWSRRSSSSRCGATISASSRTAPPPWW